MQAHNEAKILTERRDNKYCQSSSKQIKKKLLLNRIFGPNNGVHFRPTNTVVVHNMTDAHRGTVFQPENMDQYLKREGWKLK